MAGQWAYHRDNEQEVRGLAKSILMDVQQEYVRRDSDDVDIDDHYAEYYAEDAREQLFEDVVDWLVEIDSPLCRRDHDDSKVYLIDTEEVVPYIRMIGEERLEIAF